MSNIRDCYNFAQNAGMWYDISTGDILSEASANKLVKSKVRVSSRESKLLAINVMQFGPFHTKMNSAVKSDNVKVVNIIDKWTNDTFILQPKGAASRKSVLKLIHDSGITSYEENGYIVVMKKDRENVIDMLSGNFRVIYKSKETKNQELRDKSMLTFQYQNNVKGQDRIFKLTHGDHVLFAICDGHGGDTVIDYITLNKVKFLSLIVEPFPTSTQEALERTTKIFVKFENEMRHTIDASHSGSTMVFAAHNMRTQKVFFGYIGDSRAVFQQNPSSAIISTSDHKPSDIAETRRIRALGGNVTYNHRDVPRVNGNLATSRSFGDESLKSQGNDRDLDLVSVIPNIVGPFDFESQSVYFLASDGIFDVVTNDEVIDVLRSNKEPADIGPYFSHTARTRGSRDDISVGIVIGV
jgi:protein phosphatase 1L